MSKHSSIKIVNPLSGGAAYCSVERARRHVKKGFAKFDSNGQLVFTHQHQALCWRGSQVIVPGYAGCDAFPDRAVLPPSPEVLARMEHHDGRVCGLPERKPVRPPLKRSKPVPQRVNN